MLDFTGTGFCHLHHWVQRAIVLAHTLQDQHVLVVHLTRGLFPVSQSSYCQGYSTETTILSIRNDLMCTIDDHRSCTLRPAGCQSFHFYLSTWAAFWCMQYITVMVSIVSVRLHTQSFFVDGIMSTPQPASCSVPHGSSAGQSEFIAYTEDVSLLYKQHNVRHHLCWRHVCVCRDLSCWCWSRLNYAAGLHQHVLSTVWPQRCGSLHVSPPYKASQVKSCQLQLSSNKTDLIWFGSRASIVCLSVCPIGRAHM